jgi:hypothetical protein
MMDEDLAQRAVARPRFFEIGIAHARFSPADSYAAIATLPEA